MPFRDPELDVGPGLFCVKLSAFWLDFEMKPDHHLTVAVHEGTKGDE